VTESISRLSGPAGRLQSEQRRASAKENPYQKDLHTVS